MFLRLKQCRDRPQAVPPALPLPVKRRTLSPVQFYQLELNAKSAQRLPSSSTQLCKSGKGAGAVNIGIDVWTGRIEWGRLSIQ